MLGLIAFALLILACSYWKLSEDAERDLEADEGDEASKAEPPVMEEKFLPISKLKSVEVMHSEFEKLKCGSGSSESLQSGLVALAQLYNSFEEFRRNKSSGVDGVDRKSMEESLSRSVDLLDTCGTVREVLQMMRENVRALQPAMWRKGTDSNSAVQNDDGEVAGFEATTTRRV
ncbi:hypothetical protein SASPL_150847 [Salvia splendens]|uniref:Uncharacterized protein n=1 Tax=Salvia splendens TaxID=180675 RepID=A0A8X8W838_SALSN|nr:hypothetical protein SASPL_150847 [Salvia splendens]